jgi:serine/threonine protein kinase
VKLADPPPSRLQYRAPECLLTDGYYGYKMDLWGIGCVMFEVIALFPLFPGTNELDQIERIHNIVGTPPPTVLAKFKKYATHMEFNFAEKVGTGIAKLIPHAGETCIDLIQKLLAYDPENRLSARQALRHPYFSELRQADKARERAAAKEATTEGDAATQGGEKAGPGGAPALAAPGTAPSASNDSSESPDAAPRAAAPPKKKKDKQQQQQQQQQQQDHQDQQQQQQLQQPPQQQQQQLRQQQGQQFRDEHDDSTTADATGGADAASSATRSPQKKALPNVPKAQRVNANADQPLPLPAIPKPAKDNAKAAAGAGAGAGLPSKQYDAQGYISSINNQTYSSSSVYSGSQQQQQQQQQQLPRQQQQQQQYQQQGLMYDAYGNPSKQKQQQQYPPPPQQPKPQQQPPRTYDDYGASSKRGTAHSSEALGTRGNKASNARTYHEYDSGDPKQSPDAKAGSSLKSAKYQSPYSQRYIARQRVIT